MGMNLGFVYGLQIQVQRENEFYSRCKLRVKGGEFGERQCDGRKLFVQEV